MRHSGKLAATGMICAALLAGSAVLAAGVTRPHNSPGITSSKVTLGAIVTQSGGLQADFAPYLSGANAYFDYVNAAGGVDKRQIDLSYPLDDGSSGTNDINDAQTLVNTDHVFAVVGISVPFFDAHTFLAKTSTPVFGYSTSNVWAGPKTFFADYGSVLNYNSSIPDFAFVAKQTKSTKIAVVALGYASSQDECKGAIAGLKKYKFNVVYSNVNESPLQNWSIEANNIRQHGANMVVSCMDVYSSIALSKELAAYHVKPVQLWLDGYDRSILTASGNNQYMQNVYFLLQHLPFEGAAVYPNAYPGLNLYLQQMVRFGFSSDEYSDVALAGWESAALFVSGLKAAGANPTQASVTAAINKIKADTGGPNGGVAAPTNWMIAHTVDASPACETFVQAKGNNFSLAFNHGSDPWICFPLKGTANLSKPVKPPAGTPGA